MISWRNLGRMLTGGLFLAALVIQPLAAQSAKPGPAIIVDEPERSGPSVGNRTVPVELLRHPIAQKTRRVLQKALDEIESGSPEAAIGRLQEMLAKHPEAAYFAYSLLGFAYRKAERFASAVDSFEKALTIVPGDSVNHYNLGLSLLSAGSFERGRQEVRRALELDPSIDTAKALLDSLATVKQVRR